MSLAVACVLAAAAIGCDGLWGVKCRLGDGAACGVLGDRARGRGDREGSCRFYRRACAADHDEGCSNLGALLAQKQCAGAAGEAAAALRKSCGRDHPGGCNNLAMMFRDGVDGLAADHARAAELFRQACRRDAAACENLAAMLMTDHDEGGAFAALRAGCELGGGPAAARCCYKEGLAYDEGLGVKADATLATQLHARACVGSVGAACYALGVRELAMDAEAEKQRAAYHFRLACEAGMAAGCNNLGLMYATGAGVARDDRRAVELLQKGCDGGELRACANVGSRYLLGDGVAEDTVRGRALVDRACRGGVVEACLPADR
jgi:TPR repeat protein